FILGQSADILRSGVYMQQNKTSMITLLTSWPSKETLGKPRAVYEYKKEKPSNAKLICNGTMIFLFKVN
ncbi:TPA: hypothetical protein ACT9HT_002537, partial [Legionella pneumophila]